MKNIIKSVHCKLYIFIYSLVLIIGCTNIQGPIAIMFEFESGHYQNLTVENDSLALGGKYLSMKDSGQVVWNVVVPDSAYYSIQCRYRALGGSKEQILLKNRIEIPIGFSMAEEWNTFSQPFFLNKGDNTIGIKSSWGHMDFDYIEIRSFIIEPQISPLKQTIYKSQDCLLVYKVDNFNQPITKVQLNQQNIDFEIKPYPYQEKSVWVEIPNNALNNLSVGECDLEVFFDVGSVKSRLLVCESVPTHGLTIVVPDVEHGASVLIKLPTGKNMLIDTGKEWVRDSILIPMFKRNGVDTIHTLILTHYHGDHDSGDKGQLIMEEFHVQNFVDYKTYSTGHVWNTDSVSIKILNSYADGLEENKRSLAFTLEYNGFVYNHGGDTYAVNQKRMLHDFGSENKAHIFFANHHFHGSVLPEYIHQVNPDVVLLQAQEAIYARSAFMVNYKIKSEAFLNSQRTRPVETLVALDLGATVISIQDSVNWWYRTYKNQDEIVFPEFNLKN